MPCYSQFRKLPPLPTGGVAKCFRGDAELGLTEFFEPVDNVALQNRSGPPPLDTHNRPHKPQRKAGEKCEAAGRLCRWSYTLRFEARGAANASNSLRNACAFGQDRASAVSGWMLAFFAQFVIEWRTLPRTQPQEVAEPVVVLVGESFTHRFGYSHRSDPSCRRKKDDIANGRRLSDRGAIAATSAAGSLGPRRVWRSAVRPKTTD